MLLVTNIVRFVGLLRDAGVHVHGGRVPDVVSAMERVGVSRRTHVKAAMRSLLIHRREDISLFDDAFDRFWRARKTLQEGLPLVSLGERPRVVASPRAGTSVTFDSDEDGSASSARPLAVGAWSSAAMLRTRDFAELSPLELVQAEAMLDRMTWRLGRRRTRRWVRASSGTIHLRPIVRANMAYGGELVQLPRRVRRERARPVVVLADVSGSMERYARMLLQFVYGLSATARDVESFVFSTTLTRVTRELSRGGGGKALSRVVGRVRDWGGGTRIGDALRAFNLHYARRVMRHGPIVIIISDGWDRGDPEHLARELARLGRSCRRLIWLNPLLGSATYEPLTRGMQAALPHIDDFLPAHNLVSLEQLAAHLVARGT
jgi:uncharacterized protein with von Willebrand factor type A (vWA) domain